MSHTRTTSDVISLALPFFLAGSLSAESSKLLSLAWWGRVPWWQATISDNQVVHVLPAENDEAVQAFLLQRLYQATRATVFGDRNAAFCTPICDLLKPGPNMGGRPRGDRFEAIATDLRMMTEGTLVSRGRVVLLLDCESADESGAKEALWQLAPYCDVRVRIELKVSYQHGCKSSVKAPIALPG